METVEESYDGEVRRKITRKSYKIEEVRFIYFLGQRPLLGKIIVFRRKRCVL